MSAPEAKRVAILGGGAAALTTALALTDPRNGGRYKVTVYQMGWRLGGKGASGRNADLDQRIQEHGIHVWFGFYDNAFRLLDGCYRELEERREKTSPPWSLGKCIGRQPPPADNGAFYPHDDYFMFEQVGKAWKRWHVHAPRNQRTPGDGAPLAMEDSFGWTKLREMLVSVAELRKKGIFAPAVKKLESVDPEPRADDFEKAVRRRSPLERAAGELGADDYLEAVLDGLNAPTLPPGVNEPNESLLDGFRLRFRFVAWGLRRARDVAQATRAFLLTARQRDEWRPEWKDEEYEALRRIYETLDTCAAIATGIYTDVIAKGLESFDHLDDVDLRKWLAGHGAADNGENSELLLQNPTIRFVYNSAFSFVDGDHERPQIAAGAALRGILRLFLTYKGALSYRMSSGMGDVVFSPIYEVLKRRGVTFKFFHRVERLELGGGADPVLKAVHFTKQVELRDEDKGAQYQPFVWVKGFPAWPDRPLTDQIVGGEVLRDKIAGGLNLEDPGAPCPGDTKVRVTVGEGEDGDFDEVVLGIPVAALPKLSTELSAHARIGERWRKMLDGVKTTPTQAFQLWLRASLRDLGWKDVAPVSGTYVDPIDTYIDMTPALQLEERGAGDVKGLAYFCGVIKKLENETAAAGNERATRNAIEHLTQRVHELWPRIRSGDNFDWSLLARSPRDAKTPAQRFAGQYARANVLPSDLYTLGLPGTTAARLPADGAGVRNLFLTGDWTLNPINLGCVEATVMSGLLTARAVSGQPVDIIGEHDAYLWESLGRGRGNYRTLEAATSSTAAVAAAFAASTGSPAGPRGGEAKPWTPQSLQQLQAAVKRYDRAAAERLCETLIAHLRASDEPVADRVGEDVLATLQSKRFFPLMLRVADALRADGNRSPQIRRRYAQALIEEGKPSAALDVLAGLTAQSDDLFEAEEALGLIGRANKQIFVEASDRQTEKIRNALGQAIANYRKPWERDPERNTWHGINLVALLARAQREGVVPAAAHGLDAEKVNDAVLAALAHRRQGQMTHWDYATLVEAEVARKNYEAALKAMKHYVVEGDAFDFGSLLRQLQQVWQLDGENEHARALLTYLRAHLLGAQGGRLDFQSSAMRAALDAADGLQRILGHERPVALTWYQLGLQRCRLVGIVRNQSGRGEGTGFVVRARDFLPRHPQPDELLFLTNAHVVGPTASLSLAQAGITFDFPDPDVPKEAAYRLGDLRAKSPPGELDYTLASFEPPLYADKVATYPIAAAPRNPIGDDIGRERLYIVGHPQGRPMELSLNDNHVLAVNVDKLQYHTPTEPGSSGSPVFNAAWELVGLHHAGGLLPHLDKVSADHSANEGIRIDRIREVLRAQ